MQEKNKLREHCLVKNGSRIYLEEMFMLVIPLWDKRWEWDLRAAAPLLIIIKEVSFTG
jgi:hypothetical protein